jgi:hypothetical protein
VSDIEHRAYARHGVSVRAFARDVAREQEALRLIREEVATAVRANVAPPTSWQDFDGRKNL